MSRRRGREGAESGSVLMLVPAIALVAMGLAALVVDLDYLYMAKSELENRVEAAATAAVDQLSQADLYQGSAVQIDPALAREIAGYQLTGVSTHGYRVTGVSTAVAGNSICVLAQARVELPAFGPLLGATPASQIQARSIATLPAPGQDPATAPVPWC
ncbi:MAG: pilus assembly protein TadG-related protein [Actinomycetota bacterium]|nr:pilus assembly protein TadG-related protein [Actinomycetota bacterium]